MIRVQSKNRFPSDFFQTDELVSPNSNTLIPASFFPDSQGAAGTSSTIPKSGISSLKSANYLSPKNVRVQTGCSSNVKNNTNRNSKMKLSLPVRTECDEANVNPITAFWSNTHIQSFEIYPPDDAVDAGNYSYSECLPSDIHATEPNLHSNYHQNNKFQAAAAAVESYQTSQRVHTESVKNPSVKPFIGQKFTSPQSKRFSNQFEQNHTNNFEKNEIVAAKNKIISGGPSQQQERNREVIVEANVRIGSPKASISYNPRLPMKVFAGSINTANEASATAAFQSILSPRQMTAASVLTSGFSAAVSLNKEKGKMSIRNPAAIQAASVVANSIGQQPTGVITKAIGMNRLNSASSIAGSKRVVNDSDLKVGLSTQQNGISLGKSEKEKRNSRTISTAVPFVTNSVSAAASKDKEIQDQPAAQSAIQQQLKAKKLSSATITSKSRQNSNVDFTNFKIPPTNSVNNKKINSQEGKSNVALPSASKENSSNVARVAGKESLSKKPRVRPQSAIIKEEIDVPIPEMTLGIPLSKNSQNNSEKLSIVAETAQNEQIRIECETTTSVCSSKRDIKVMGDSRKSSLHQSSSLLSPRRALVSPTTTTTTTTIAQVVSPSRDYSSQDVDFFGSVMRQQQSQQSSEESHITSMMHSPEINSDAQSTHRDFAQYQYGDAYNLTADFTLVRRERKEDEQTIEEQQQQLNLHHICSADQHEDNEEFQLQQLQKLHIQGGGIPSSSDNNFNLFTCNGSKTSNNNNNNNSSGVSGNLNANVNANNTNGGSAAEYRRGKCQPKIALNVKESEKFRPFLIRKVSSQSSVRTKQTAASASATSDGLQSSSPNSVSSSYKHFHFDFNRNSSNSSSTNQGKSNLSTPTLLTSTECINSHEFSFSNS